MSHVTCYPYRVDRLRNARLYVITDLQPKSPSIYKKAERALSGGADILQLRSKALLDGEFLAVGRRLRSLSRKKGRLFFVNDRPHIARLLDADGLHLGQDDLPMKEARRIVGARMLIGKSTHSIRQALSAEREGADYIGVGPVYKTPTKPDYSAVGLRLVKEAAKKIKIPFVAIGGIDEANVSEVIRAGARCIAVVRAVMGAKDPERSAKRMRQIIIDTLKKQVNGRPI